MISSYLLPPRQTYTSLDACHPRASLPLPHSGSVLWLASNLVTLGGALAHADLSHDAAGGVKAAVELLLNLPGVAEVGADWVRWCLGCCQAE